MQRRKFLSRFAGISFLGLLSNRSSAMGNEVEDVAITRDISNIKSSISAGRITVDDSLSGITSLNNLLGRGSKYSVATLKDLFELTPRSLIKGSVIEVVDNRGFWKLIAIENISRESNFDQEGRLIISSEDTTYTFENISPVIHVEQWGMIGSELGEGKIWQLAVNAAERLSKPLHHDGTKKYSIDQTVYLGDVYLITNGCIFNIDTSQFRTVGTALRSNEGAILTKSAEGAGFSNTLVSIKFDQLRLYFSRKNYKVNGVKVIKTPLLLEQVELFQGGDLESLTSPSNFSKTPVDFYSGVQNVNVGRLITSCKNTSNRSAGGIWIRNFNKNRPTKNISIDEIIVNHSGKDECLAIFNVKSGRTACDVNNISIGRISGHTSGLGVSVMDKIGGYDFSSIRIDTIDLVLRAAKINNPFLLKFENASPSLGNVRLKFEDLSGVTGFAYLVRSIQKNRSVRYPLIEHANLILDTRASRVKVFANEGKVDYRFLKVRSIGVQPFQRIINNANFIYDCDIDAPYIDKSIRSVKYLSGRFNGELENVSQVYGQHIINRPLKNSLGVYLVNYLKVENRIKYDVELIVDIKIDVAKVANFNGAGNKQRMADIDIYIRNIANATIGAADFFDSSGFRIRSYSSIVQDYQGILSARPIDSRAKKL